MKNFKIFCEAQIASHIKKYFLTEIYRNIQTFAFQVLRECSSWAFRNGAVQMFFLTPTKKMFAEKFAKRVRFLAVLY